MTFFFKLQNKKIIVCLWTCLDFPWRRLYVNRGWGWNLLESCERVTELSGWWTMIAVFPFLFGGRIIKERRQKPVAMGFTNLTPGLPRTFYLVFSDGNTDWTIFHAKCWAPRLTKLVFIVSSQKLILLPYHHSICETHPYLSEEGLEGPSGANEPGWISEEEKDIGAAPSLCSAHNSYIQGSFHGDSWRAARNPRRPMCLWVKLPYWSHTLFSTWRRYPMWFLPGACCHPSQPSIRHSISLYGNERWLHNTACLCKDRLSHESTLCNFYLHTQSWASHSQLGETVNKLIQLSGEWLLFSNKVSKPADPIQESFYWTGSDPQWNCLWPGESEGAPY